MAWKIKVCPKILWTPEMKYEHSLRTMSTWKLNRISHDCSTQFFIDRIFFQVATSESSLSSPLGPIKKKKTLRVVIINGKTQCPAKTDGNAEHYSGCAQINVPMGRQNLGIITPKCLLSNLWLNVLFRHGTKGFYCVTDWRVQDSTKVDLVHLQVIYTQWRLFDNFHIPCISPVNTKSGGKSSVNSRYYVKNVFC